MEADRGAKWMMAVVLGGPENVVVEGIKREHWVAPNLAEKKEQLGDDEDGE